MKNIINLNTLNAKAKSADTVNAASELLKHARDLVAAGWTKNVYARPGKGQQAVDINSPKAQCFCAAGAIARAAQDLGHPFSSPILREAANRISIVMGVEFIEVNDHRDTKQEHVVMAFDLAALGAGASPIK